jgi:hypothetical protein
MNPIAPLVAAISTIVHLLPWVGIPAVIAGFIYKAVAK